MSLLGQWKAYPAFMDRLLSLVGIEVHWAILQYVLGLSFLSFVAYLVYLKTKEEKWRKLSWTLFKGFVIVFAVGAATGTASEFGLVLLWPNLTEAAGRFVYFPLYAEVFAFLMEVVFIYMIYYGWKKFSPKVLAVLLLLGFIGPWYSAAMIVSVNSYMVAPTGVVPAYKLDGNNGVYLYDQGYPKITLVVPNDLVKALNVTALQKAGVEVKGKSEYGVIVEMPARMVQRLAYESWNGYTVKDSILAYVANKSYVQQHPEILNLPVKAIVFQVLDATIKYVGVMSVTFKSPVYAASILHVLGAALTVSSFTVMAAYGLRLLRRDEYDDEYLEYVRAGFKFGAIAALVFIAIQGFVFGHLMGRAVAEYNPEKFAAMEGTSSQIFQVTKLLPGGEKLVAFLAYDNPHAQIPVYDKIPRNYCYCQLTSAQDANRIADCRPPLVIHYLYYTKITLGILLGLYAALIGYFLVIKKKRPDELPKFVLHPALLLLAVILVQLVSFLGWATREIGRKPFTIYGVMTVDVAHTANPASAGVVSLVALFFIVVLAALAYAVWKILWVPGKPRVEVGAA